MVMLGSNLDIGHGTMRRTFIVGILGILLTVVVTDRLMLKAADRVHIPRRSDRCPVGHVGVPAPLMATDFIIRNVPRQCSRGGIAGPARGYRLSAN
jgi:hypothetical protein